MTVFVISIWDCGSVRLTINSVKVITNFKVIGDSDCVNIHFRYKPQYLSSCTFRTRLGNEGNMNA